MYTCQSQSPNSSHHHHHHPLPLPPLVSIRLFSTSVSQLLPCKPVHLYHFSRFHIYALIYNICFSLSDLLHSVWQTLDPSTSLQMQLVCWSSVSYSIYTPLGQELCLFGSLLWLQHLGQCFTHSRVSINVSDVTYIQWCAGASHSLWESIIHNLTQTQVQWYQKKMPGQTHTKKKKA